MDARPLSDDMIAAGRTFLDKLDEFGLNPEAAAWFKDQKREDWRYVVATSAVDVVGRRRIYGAILYLFDAHKFGNALTSFDVHLVSPREPWYAMMKGALQVPGNSGVRLTESTVNGVFVPDAYLYRFFSPPKKQQLLKNVQSFEKRAKKAAERLGA